MFIVAALLAVAAADQAPARYQAPTTAAPRYQAPTTAAPSYQPAPYQPASYKQPSYQEPKYEVSHAAGRRIRETAAYLSLDTG